MILHDYRRCPFCIRVRIVLHLKMIPYQAIHEPLREWTNWMRDNIDKPKVPMLRVLDERGIETVIPESNDINVWLDSNFGEKRFIPDIESKEYKEMLEWWSWCGDIFKHQIDLFKYGENRVFNEEKHLIHLENLKKMIQKIEESLIDDYLLGNNMTLADIAIIPFIRQIMRTRNGEFDFSSYPKVKTWSGRILEQDWFNNVVMAKHN